MNDTMYLLFVLWHLSGQPEKFSVLGFRDGEACEEARVKHVSDEAPISRKVFNTKEFCISRPAVDPCSTMAWEDRHTTMEWIARWPSPAIAEQHIGELRLYHEIPAWLNLYKMCAATLGIKHPGEPPP